MGTIHPPFYRWQEKLGHKQGSVGDHPRSKPQLSVRAEHASPVKMRPGWLLPSSR